MSRRKKLLRESTISRFMTLAGNSRYSRKFLNEELGSFDPSLDTEPMDEMEMGAEEEFYEGDFGMDEPLDDAEGGEDGDLDSMLLDDLLYEIGDEDVVSDAAPEPTVAPPVPGEDPALDAAEDPASADVDVDPEVEPGPEGDQGSVDLDMAAIEDLADFATAAKAALPHIDKLADAAGLGAAGDEAIPGEEPAPEDLGAPPEEPALGDEGPPPSPEAGPEAGPPPPPGAAPGGPEDEIAEEVLEALLNKGKLNKLTNEIYKRVAKKIIQEKLRRR